MQSLEELSYADIQYELKQKLKDMGIKHISPFWSAEFLEKVRMTESGPEREALKARGVRELLTVAQKVEDGDYTPLTFNDADEKTLPADIVNTIKTTKLDD